MSDLGLNEQLQPVDSPVTSGSAQSGYDTQSNMERNTITNGQIRTLTADKLTVGTINADVAYAGTITADQIYGGTLTLGGTTNGNGVMVIKNAAGTTIIQGDNDGHNYYTDAGVRQIRVDETGLTAYAANGTTPIFALSNGGFYGYGTTGSIIRLRTDAASTVNFGAIGYGTTSGLGLYMTSPYTVYYGAGEDMWVVSTDQSSLIGSVALIYAEQSGGTAEVLSEGHIKISAPNSGKDVEIISGDDVNITTGGDFVLNGSIKTAIVPTTAGYKALYAMESPSVWFMDFIDTKDKLDPLFIEVTEPPYKYIKCDDETYQVWGKRKGYKDTRFENKTINQFKTNNELYSGRVVNRVEKIEQATDRLAQLREQLKKS